jgi:hypothetical protein
VYYLFICLCCLCLIATIRRRSFWESLRARHARLWAAASGRARQVTLDHIDPMCSLSLSSIHIGLHALILYLSLILRIWVHTWLVMLSHAVLSVVQVFPSLWCWVWLVECWECWSSIRRDVRWPWWGSMLWFKQSLEWWRRLESVRWGGMSCSNLLRTKS